MFFLFFISFLGTFSLLGMELNLSTDVIKHFSNGIRTMLAQEKEIELPNNLFSIYQEVDEKMTSILNSPNSINMQLLEKSGFENEINEAKFLWWDLQLEVSDFKQKLPWLLTNILKKSGIQFPENHGNTPGYHKAFLVANKNLEKKLKSHLIGATLLLSKYAVEIKPQTNKPI